MASGAKPLQSVDQEADQVINESDQPTPLSDGDFLVMLQAEYNDAVGPAESELANRQDKSLEVYYGHPYGDEMEGRSQVVARDVANAVDWMMPDLLEPFISGTKPIVFKPQKQEDDEYAKQASDYVTHIIFEDNPGFQILYDVAKDGLIQKSGVCKIFWRDTADIIADELVNANIMSVQALQEDDEVEIFETESQDIESMSEEEMETLDPELYPDGMVYTISFERRRMNQTVGLESVPPEEFRIARRSSSLHDAYYAAQEVKMTLSELIEMGFDPDLVFGLPSTDDRATERQDVRFEGEYKRIDKGGPDPSQNEVTLLEEYIRADRNGDGIGELIQVFRVQNTILEETEVPFIPFFDFCPDPMPHRFYGQSLTDKSFDTQRINTTLQRQMLDNLYLANLPQKVVDENQVNENTYADLLTPRIGSIIRAGSVDAIREVTTQDRSSSALQAIQFFKSVRGEDTGVTRTPISLSAESIDPKKTATEVAQTEQSDTIRKRLMARIFAERFFEPLCEAVLKYVIKYQDKERIIQLRGEWVPMEPQYWNSNMKAVAEVGLGYENKEANLVSAQMIMSLQAQTQDQGLSSPQHIYNNMEKVVDALGYGFVSDFFIDPASPEGQQIAQQKAQEPDPETAKIQAEQQAKQQEAQMKHQREMQKMQVDAQFEQMKLQAEMQLAFAKLQMETVTARTDDQMDYDAAIQKIQAQFQESMEKMDTEAQLAMIQTQVEAELAVRAQNIDAVKDIEVERMRPGGALNK